jgi:hypothetical protein
MERKLRHFLEKANIVSSSLRLQELSAQLRLLYTRIYQQLPPVPGKTILRKWLAGLSGVILLALAAQLLADLLAMLSRDIKGMESTLLNQTQL